VVDKPHEFAGLFSDYEWLMVAITAIVYAAVLFAVVRYRRRRDEWPRGRDEAKVAESIYAGAIAVLVALLIAATFATESKTDALSAHPKLKIDVTAFQWQWKFRYPETGRTIVGTDTHVPTLVVPAHTQIEFTESSPDVIHSFWIPTEKFKRDAFPDRTTRFDLVFDHLGVEAGHCAEFCGLRHADMNFRVRVVTPSAFRTWLGSSA
jgi:cytochrome c oxidase subunit 2